MKYAWKLVQLIAMIDREAEKQINLRPDCEFNPLQRIKENIIYNFEI